jgi:hypothetical protein
MLPAFVVLIGLAAEASIHRNSSGVLC